MKFRIRRLCICAVFTALICVVTAFVSMPAGPVGNINLGDAFIIIATFLLGPYGAIAGGFGAMLADLIGAYVIYAPGTLLIKIALSLVCHRAYLLAKKLTRLDYISRVIGAVLGEIVMILGYFLYEGALYDFKTALASVPFNLIQGGVAITLGTLTAHFVLKNTTVNKFIDSLK